MVCRYCLARLAFCLVVWASSKAQWLFYTGGSVFPTQFWSWSSWRIGCYLFGYRHYWDSHSFPISINKPNELLLHSPLPRFQTFILSHQTSSIHTSPRTKGWFFHFLFDLMDDLLQLFLRTLPLLPMDVTITSNQYLISVL